MNCIFCDEPIEAHFSFCEACGKPLTGLPVFAMPGEPEGALKEDALGAGGRCACGGARFDSEGYCESCGHRITPQDAVDTQQIDGMAACASHRGRHHTENQDAVLMQVLPRGLALALADGVSTACHARAAADKAVQTAVQALHDGAALPPAERVRQAVWRAHEAVSGLPHDDVQLAEPQATLVLALVQDDQLWHAWVGDSRLYLFDEAESVQLTQDDSWLNEQLNDGVAMETALRDANAHCITQCLGMRDDEPQVHVDTRLLQPGAILLLCSDGLWNYCDAPEALRKLIHGAAPAGLAQTCRACVAFANASGGQDNVTIALYRHSA
jgi:serine/threonine protein phosphatase PrpC